MSFALTLAEPIKKGWNAFRAMSAHRESAPDKPVFVEPSRFTSSPTKITTLVGLILALPNIADATVFTYVCNKFIASDRSIYCYKFQFFCSEWPVVTKGCSGYAIPWNPTDSLIYPLPYEQCPTTLPDCDNLSSDPTFFPGVAYLPPIPEKNLGGDCPDVNGPSCAAKNPEVQNSGNPIQNATGNKFQVETDYAGGGDFPLVFQRFYNSQSAITDGVLGAGWSHSYSSHLKVISPTQIQMVRDDQKILTFTLDTLSVNQTNFIADGDINSRLTSHCTYPLILAGTLINCVGDAGYTYVTGDDKTERYDANGVLQSIADREGRTQTLDYDAVTKRLMTITDPAGRVLTLNYWQNTYLSALIFPDAEKIQYDYLAGNLNNVFNPDLTYKTYVYEDVAFPHALTGIVDETRNRFATWGYDGNGLAVSSEHAGGVEKVTMAYDLANGKTTVTDANGTARTYMYETVLGVPRPLHALQPPAFSTNANAHWAHDNNGNIYWEQDFNGNVTTHVYDLVRNLETSRTEALGTPQERTITTEWHPAYRLPTKITEPLKRIDLAYYPNGDLETRTVTDTATNVSRTWSYTYDGPGRVKTVDGPRTDVADVTTYGYDPVTHDLTSSTNALGHVTTIQPDANGRPHIITDSNGLVTTLTWNPRGWLDSRKAGVENPTLYKHDINDTLTGMTMPGGETLTYVPDPAHRITTIKDALGNQMVYGLDAMDNVKSIEVVNAAGGKVKTETRDYDSLNRLWHVYNAAKQATATLDYDANGNPKTLTDGNQHSTLRLYDALNRLDSLTAGLTATDTVGKITDYSYDANDGLTQNLDPKGNNTVITRNGFGEVTQIQSPDAGTTSLERDEAGNIHKKTDANGNAITYTYDALNRETYAADPSDVNFQTVWDKDATGNGCIGKPRILAFTGGDTTFKWDANCLLRLKIQTVQYTKRTLTLGWNAQTGRLVNMIYPSGMVIGYSYDKAGQVSALKVNGNPLMSKITHFPFGSARSWVWGAGAGAGVNYARGFDLDGRIKKFPLDGTGTVRTLGRDAGGLTRTITDTNGATLLQKQVITYDAFDRVKTFTNGTITQSYGLDANGNRKTGPKTANSATFAEPTDRLLTTKTAPAAAVPITTDAAGYVKDDGARSYYHSPRGALRQALPKGGALQIYGHSNMHEPVITINNATQAAKVRLYDVEGAMLLGEYAETYNLPTATQAVAREYIYLDGNIPVAVTATGGKTATAANFYRIYADELTTPRKVTTADGNTVVWDWSKTDPFGSIAPSASFAMSLRFPGQHLDPATGLFMNHYRNYDAKQGRYIEPDPIGLAGGQNNLFTYVGGNPVGLIDPYGLEFTEAEKQKIKDFIMHQTWEKVKDFTAKKLGVSEYYEQFKELKENIKKVKDFGETACFSAKAIANKFSDEYAPKALQSFSELAKYFRGLTPLPIVGIPQTYDLGNHLVNAENEVANSEISPTSTIEEQEAVVNRHTGY